nr:hypothetical protein [Burkholderia gladioli]
MTEAEQIAELRAALQTLVSMHHDWDKGTAYITVRFMQDNNTAIKAAREILAKTA